MRFNDYTNEPTLLAYDEDPKTATKAKAAVAARVHLFFTFDQFLGSSGSSLENVTMSYRCGCCPEACEGARVDSEDESCIAAKGRAGRLMMSGRRREHKGG